MRVSCECVFSCVESMMSQINQWPPPPPGKKRSSRSGTLSLFLNLAGAMNGARDRSWHCSSANRAGGGFSSTRRAPNGGKSGMDLVTSDREPERTLNIQTRKCHECEKLPWLGEQPPVINHHRRRPAGALRVRLLHELSPLATGGRPRNGVWRGRPVAILACSEARAVVSRCPRQSIDQSISLGAAVRYLALLAGRQLRISLASSLLAWPRSAGGAGQSRVPSDCGYKSARSSSATQS